MDKIAHGFPVVTCETVFGVLEELGIKKWSQLRLPQPLDEFLRSGIEPHVREEALRFAPKSEVVFLRHPNGSEWRGYRSVHRKFACTLCVLPDELIPVTAEYKHGSGMNGEVCVVPPVGMISDEDLEHEDPLLACGKREFEEESGLKLQRAERLGDNIGMVVRYDTVQMCAVLGHAADPIVQGPQKLDRDETLKIVLFPANEWYKFVFRMGRCHDSVATLVTARAFARLGLVEFAG